MKGFKMPLLQMFSQLFNPIDDDEAMFTRFGKAFFYDFEEDKPGALPIII